MSAFRVSSLVMMTLLGLSPSILAADAAPIQAADAAAVHAESDQHGLSGDWGAKRTQLEADGLSFGAVYKGDYFWSQQGDEDSSLLYAANYDLRWLSMAASFGDGNTVKPWSMS